LSEEYYTFTAGNITIRLPTDFLAKSVRIIDGKKYQFSQIIEWDFQKIPPNYSIRGLPDEKVKILSINFREIPSDKQSIYSIMSLEINAKVRD
jgi:hypothetical protein